MAWVSTSEAAEILSVAPRTLYQHKDWFRCVERRSNNGKSPRGGGWQWSRDDVEHLQFLCRGADLTLSNALRVMALLKWSQERAAA